jgi:hypothetical protein
VLSLLCCRLQYMALALDTRSLGAGSHDSRSLEDIHWQTFRDDKDLAEKALKSRPDLRFDRRARGIWPHVPADILGESWEERQAEQMRREGRSNRVDATLQAMTPADRSNWFRVSDLLPDCQSDVHRAFLLVESFAMLHAIIVRNTAAGRQHWQHVTMTFCFVGDCP